MTPQRSRRGCLGEAVKLKLSRTWSWPEARDEWRHEERWHVMHPSRPLCSATHSLTIVSQNTFSISLRQYSATYRKRSNSGHLAKFRRPRVGFPEACDYTQARLVPGTTAASQLVRPSSGWRLPAARSYDNWIAAWGARPEQDHAEREEQESPVK